MIAAGKLKHWLDVIPDNAPITIAEDGVTLVCKTKHITAYLYIGGSDKETTDGGQTESINSRPV